MISRFTANWFASDAPMPNLQCLFAGCHCNSRGSNFTFSCSKMAQRAFGNRKFLLAVFTEATTSDPSSRPGGCPVHLSEKINTEISLKQEQQVDNKPAQVRSKPNAPATAATACRPLPRSSCWVWKAHTASCLRSSCEVRLTASAHAFLLLGEDCFQIGWPYQLCYCKKISLGAALSAK